MSVAVKPSSNPERYRIQKCPVYQLRYPPGLELWEIAVLVGISLGCLVPFTTHFMHSLSTDIVCCAIFSQHH